MDVASPPVQESIRRIAGAGTAVVSTLAAGSGTSWPWEDCWLRVPTRWGQAHPRYGNLRNYELLSEAGFAPGQAVRTRGDGRSSPTLLGKLEQMVRGGDVPRGMRQEERVGRDAPRPDGEPEPAAAEAARGEERERAGARERETAEAGGVNGKGSAPF